MLISKKVVSTLVLMSGLTFAHAGEVNFTIGSYHFDDNESHNNINPGIGYTFDSSVVDRLFGWEPTGYDTIGVYHNSQGRMSVYAGYYLPTPLPESWKGDSQFLRNLEVGFMFGMATGYENKLGLMPAVLLVGTYPIGKLWGDNHWHARVTVAPVMKGVATFSLSYRF